MMAAACERVAHNITTRAYQQHHGIMAHAAWRGMVINGGSSRGGERQ